MKPVYEVKAWREENWWLARVVGAGDGTDKAPLNALTQARTLAKIEPMARDLIATILDADENTFDITVDYDLPDDVGNLVHEAKTFRTWAEEAKELSQERSIAAARALAENGYSLRETAALLGLSHQRVDQLLNHSGSVMERAFAASLADHLTQTAAAAPYGTEVIVVFSRPGGTAGERPRVAEMDQQFKEEISAALLACRSRTPGNPQSGKAGEEAHMPEPRTAEVISRGWAVTA